MSDETSIICDFLGTRDVQSLSFLQSLNEHRRLDETVVRAHVEPGEAATHPFDLELAPLKISGDNVCYLQFATPGRLQASGDLDHHLITEVETCHGPT